MAVKRDTRYPGRWTPADADFPLGGPKNRTTSTSQDGSYFNRDFIADYEAFFQRLMAEGGVTANETPDTAPTSQFFEAMLNINSQEYLSTKVYSYGDVVYKTIGGVKKFFQWYSNVESLAGKDPEDTANRRPGWSDTTKPFYWKPYTTKLAGETMAWDDDNLPEIMMVGAGQQVSALTYHTLAAAKPQWIDGVDPNLLNIPDRQGRFTRAADGATWLAGQTHEDAIRNIIGKFRSGGSSGFTIGSTTEGAFEVDTSPALANNLVGSGSTGYPMVFDASNVVPTADENQPKAFIEWKGYAI